MRNFAVRYPSLPYPCLIDPIRSKIFNYNTFIKSLDFNEFVNNDSSIPCFCNEFNRCYIENDFGHIISGDLGIVNNEKLKNILSKGPNQFSLLVYISSLTEH